MRKICGVPIALLLSDSVSAAAALLAIHGGVGLAVSAKDDTMSISNPLPPPQ